MKEYELDYHIEAPDNFDVNKFVDDLIVIVEDQRGYIGGILKPYTEKNKFKKICDLFKEIIFVLRWG